MSLDSDRAAEIFKKYFARNQTISSVGILTLHVGSPEASKEVVEIVKELNDHLRQEISPALDVNRYFSSTLFIGCISDFELFLLDMLRLMISSYPRKISSFKLDLHEVLGKTQEEIITNAAERHLNALSYAAPRDYLKQFSDIMGLEKSDIKKFWPNYIEAKARRDLGVHNNWMVNSVYLRKAAEIGVTPIGVLGDYVAPSHADVSKLVQELIDFASALYEAIDKIHFRQGDAEG
ncbi:hypothetical protein FVQ98_08495 [Ottowia sp. GY511]|uniref:Uncharacterized protein n=1 Tax=Ottowia flava TaxID=2675430 RepID=A0ABW4KSL4_9BURK|nr:hypothetical protein [Ottowia sp. GY511]TXK29551.1 hypothetical protein FVQ98_08495 [Ottowia sp. GY511]